MMADKAAPATLADHYELARKARSQGDLSAAWTHMEAALTWSSAPPPTWLKLFEADLLRQEGCYSQAQAIWEELRRTDPGNIWPTFHLATLARRNGDLSAAQELVDAGKLQDGFGEAPWFILLEADLLRDTGRETQARKVLEQAAQAFPAMMWFRQRLGVMAERQNDLDAALAHFEAAAQIDETNLQVQLAVPRLLEAAGQHAAAITRLEALRRQFGDVMGILLGLVRTYRRTGQPEQEEACLVQAIATDPLDPGLLRQLFMTRTRSIASEALEQTVDRLRGTLGPDLSNDLLISCYLQSMRFDNALQVILRARKVRSNVADAQKLVVALFGTHRHITALRYLRRCLRRWPNHKGLLSIYIMQGLRQGRYDSVARQLETAASDIAPATLLVHRLKLCGYRNDLEEAAACYEELRKLGQDTPEQRSILGKLVYTRQDPMTADDLFARIGNPGAQDIPLLHRGGLVGMMTLEFELERKALAEQGGFASLAEWVQARPGSTIAAIRRVDAWCAEGGRQGLQFASAAAALPKQIFQYWDNPDPPAALAPMVASWSAVPGFSHRLMDRIDALRFLRETFGSDWVRAFQLAQNAAQEADLLRLCLLARSGGIWADADDFLYGDLPGLLARGSGLILYREPLGGALGNNIMAAPPRHPAVVFAARLACRTLLQRANENAWNKTGPGLLTRAVAQYLNRVDPAEAQRQITILDWPVVAQQVSTHNPVPYKATASYWDNTGARRLKDPIWQTFVGALPKS